MGRSGDDAMTVTLEDRVTASPRVLYKDVGGEAVLLDLDSETYFGLNATGARFWQLLTTAPSIRDAVEALWGEYDAPADELRRDMHSLVDELVRRGLARTGRA
jgi:hypothetical protein